MGFKNITIDDIDKPNQPSGKPLPDYDRAKGHTTDTRPAKRGGGLPWYVGLTLALGAFVIVGYIVVRFTQWLTDTSYETSWLDVYLIALIKIALFVAPIAAAIISCYWLYQKAAQARIIRLQNNMPIARRFVERDDWQGAALASLGAFYATEQEWARHSTYRSLNQLDLSRSYGNSGHSGMIDAPIEAAAIPTLPALAPIAAAEWLLWLDSRPHILLAAETGGGKSTTAKAILAPRIINSEHIFIIDPHSSDWLDLPSIGGGENWSEVQNAMDAVYTEYKRRLEERDSYRRETGQELAKEHFTRLTVLVDEANSARTALDKARRGEVSPWQQFAQVLGSGARKVNISIILLCQSANVEDLGLSGPMRQNFTRIALDDRSIKLMIAQEEMDAARRKDLYAALIGRAYPAATAFDGQVHILDRDGLDKYPRPTNARAQVWNAGDIQSSAVLGSRGITLTEQERKDALIALRRQGVKRDEARELYGVTFSNQEWADAGLSVEFGPFSTKNGTTDGRTDEREYQ